MRNGSGEEIEQVPDKDDCCQKRGQAACQEHGARADVEAGTITRPGGFAQTEIESLEGAVEELGHENRTNAEDEQAPFERFAAKGHSGRHQKGREKEVQEK